MKIILLLLIAILFLRYIHWKMVATAYIAWMVEHDFQQPSEQELVSLAGWCAENYAKDVFKK